jgi:hypothetical protein
MPTREAPQKHFVLVEQATHFYTCGEGGVVLKRAILGMANVPRPGLQIKTPYVPASPCRAPYGGTRKRGSVRSQRPGEKLVTVFRLRNRAR